MYHSTISHFFHFSSKKTFFFIFFKKKDAGPYGIGFYPYEMAGIAWNPYGLAILESHAAEDSFFPPWKKSGPVRAGVVRRMKIRIRNSSADRVPVRG